MFWQTLVGAQQLFELLLEVGQLLPLCCNLQLGLMMQLVLLQFLLSFLYAGKRNNGVE